MVSPGRGLVEGRKEGRKEKWNRKVLLVELLVFKREEEVVMEREDTEEEEEVKTKWPPPPSPLLIMIFPLLLLLFSFVAYLFVLEAQFTFPFSLGISWVLLPHRRLPLAERVDPAKNKFPPPVLFSFRIALKALRVVENRLKKINAVSNG